MSSDIGKIHSVETFGALDGPGIRYVLFMQGCPLKCIYCHNPDTWNVCSNRFVSPEEVLKDILKYKNFILKGGVTLSGGEPLMQPDFCKKLMSLCHQHNIHCAIDTSGSIPLSVSKEAIDEADLILLDIKALRSDVLKKITGRDKLYFKEILDYCEQIGKDVWIRHVLVPNITIKEDLLDEVAEFIKKYKCVKTVELLPFHKMGEYKWEQMGKISPLSEERVPTEEEILLSQNIFKNKGIRVI